MRAAWWLAAAAVGLTGCGGGAAALPDAPATSDLRMGLSEYRLQLSAPAVRAGTVTVRVTNAGSARHDVRLRQAGQVLAASRVLAPGEQQVLTLQVPAGPRVELDCTLGGHAAAGMTGGLRVEP